MNFFFVVSRRSSSDGCDAHAEKGDFSRFHHHVVLFAPTRCSDLARGVAAAGGTAREASCAAAVLSPGERDAGSILPLRERG